MESLVEGVFGRAFRRQIHPVEIAKGLTKQMDEGRMVSISRTYAPNDFTVHLSREDSESIRAYQASLNDELIQYASTHAENKNYHLMSPPRIRFETEDTLRFGEFGVTAKLTGGDGPREKGAPQDTSGQTRIFRTEESSGGQIDQGTATISADEARRHGLAREIVEVVLGDEKHPLEGRGPWSVGRSQENDIVINDPNVSRRHARTHRAAQLAAGAQGTAGASCCGSTIPTRARSEERFVEAIRDDLALAGARRPTARSGSRRGSRCTRRAFERLRGGGPRLSGLRDRAGARPQAQGPARARAAADLRPRGARAERCRARGEGGRGHRAALALPARPRRRRSNGPTGSAGRSTSIRRRCRDPVVRRADGSWLYMLPSAIDDIAMGVTDVLRGEDHVSNTAMQIQMFAALGAAAAALRARGAAGRQRRQAVEAAGLARLRRVARERDRARGARRAAGAARHQRSGRADRRARAAGRDASTSPSFGRAPARFDEAELARLNAAIVHQLPFDAGRRPPARRAWARRRWEAIRPNLERVADAAEWWRVVTGPVEAPAFDAETRAYLAEAARAAGSTGATIPGTRSPRRSRRRPGARARRCSCRCAWRSPGATTAPTCTRCCR